MRALSFPLRKIHSIYIYIDIYIYISILPFSSLENVTASSLYLLVHTVLITHSMRHHARIETQCFFYVYIHTDVGCCTVVVERVIAFSHGEAYARIASLATDSTRDAAHTEGEPGEDGLAGRLYILSFSFSNPIPFHTDPKSHSLLVCLSLSLRSSVFFPLARA